MNDLMQRFFLCSEGSIDHIAAYMDGFELWSDLNKRGCNGVIRGEIPFSPARMKCEFEVIKVVGLLLCRDYTKLKEVDEWGYEPQTIPACLERREGESNQSWLDRLYLEFRVPAVVSALADVKYSYVEQSMPLFTRRIIQLYCSLSDELRAGKHMFKEVECENSNYHKKFQ